MSRRTALIIAAIFIVWTWYRSTSKPSEPTVSPAPRPPKAKQVTKISPQKKTEPAVVESRPVLETKVLPPQEPQTKAPPLGIDYKIDEDGLAVAFGDMVLGVPRSPNAPKTGVLQPPTIRLWDDHTIAYHIQPNTPHPERILEALENFKGTPITFVPFTDQADAIVFEPREGHCKSYVGKMGGLQPIWLSDKCGPAEITHEIMHALGFIHEHSRTDRDNFLEIDWENIEEPYKTQFARVPEAMMTYARGFPFDYESIMIYAPTTFARTPGQTTLRSKSGVPIAPSKTLSRQDIERLFKFYR